MPRAATRVPLIHTGAGVSDRAEPGMRPAKTGKAEVCTRLRSAKARPAAENSAAVNPFAADIGRPPQSRQRRMRPRRAMPSEFGFIMPSRARAAAGTERRHAAPPRPPCHAAAGPDAPGATSRGPSGAGYAPRLRRAVPAVIAAIRNARPAGHRCPAKASRHRKPRIARPVRRAISGAWGEAPFPRMPHASSSAALTRGGDMGSA